MSYSLPKAWTLVKLHQINERQKGESIDPNKMLDTLFELYSVPALPSGRPEEILGRDIGSAKQVVEPGDVLVCKINPRINRVWVVGPRKQLPQIASSEWIVVRSAVCLPGFLRYVFTEATFREELCTDLTGVGGSLTRAQPQRVAQIKIPIAPRNEQRRIADKLDGLLAAVETCKARLDAIPAILKRFRQSVLAAATSGELTAEWRELQGVRMAWQDVRLDDIAEVQGGITKDSKKQVTTDAEVPYLRVANVQRGYLDLSEIKTIRVPHDKLPSLLLESGDVLFTEGGDIDKLGRGWIWEGQIEHCTFQNHIFRARLLNKRNQPKYISWWANHRGLSYFLGRGKQTTNLASINKSQLSALPISLPSPEEQAEIVAEVGGLLSAAEQLESKINSARARIEKLTQSLLAKAFRGELVPQDPSDEPASTLLARLRSADVVGKSFRIEGRAHRKRRRMHGVVKVTRAVVNGGSSSMIRRDDISGTYLSEQLKKSGALNAEELWRQSQLEIDDFYDQLKEEESRGLLREVRSGRGEETRMIEAVS